jgi:hypothetical protein
MTNVQRYACWVVFCLIAVVAIAQGTKVGGDTGPKDRVDLPGSDIRHFTMAAPPANTFDTRVKQCSDACAANKDCLAWTYVKPNTIQGPLGNCWLKNAIPAPVANNCCISGAVGEGNTDRPGSDYRHFDNIGGVQVTAKQCAATCFTETQCKAWTFVRPNTIQGPKGNCWLKKAIPQPVANKCCISGSFVTQVIR